MMTDSVKGKTLDEARAMFAEFHDLVTGREVDVEHLGKLAVFEGVRQYPARVKCASLAWHTLKSAVDARDQVVSTETE
jgi:nitrogen fixation NifU-like protein